MQGFGARDPYPEELASDFGNKTLGNYDTEHIVRCGDRRLAQLPTARAYDMLSHPSHLLLWISLW